MEYIYISRTTQRTNTGQVPACSEEPVDFTDTNTVETSTCLKTTQQETTNSPSDIDRIGLAHVQLRPCVFETATATKIYCELGRSWGIVLMLKSFQKRLQRRRKQPCLKIHTLFRRLMYFGRPFHRF